MGLFDKLKGKAKEAAGAASGSDSLREEGQAQQHKSDEELRAFQAEETAAEHRRAAERHEREEHRRQGT